MLGVVLCSNTQGYTALLIVFHQSATSILNCPWRELWQSLHNHLTATHSQHHNARTVLALYAARCTVSVFWKKMKDIQSRTH
jgi:hypothetical protein